MSGLKHLPIFNHLLAQQQRREASQPWRADGAVEPSWGVQLGDALQPGPELGPPYKASWPQAFFFFDLLTKRTQFPRQASGNPLLD